MWTWLNYHVRNGNKVRLTYHRHWLPFKSESWDFGHFVKFKATTLQEKSMWKMIQSWKHCSKKMHICWSVQGPISPLPACINKFVWILWSLLNSTCYCYLGEHMKICGCLTSSYIAVFTTGSSHSFRNSGKMSSEKITWRWVEFVVRVSWENRPLRSLSLSSYIVVICRCHIFLKSRCHTKRRMGAATRAHPSFGMTATKTLRSVFSWRALYLNRVVKNCHL